MVFCIRILISKDKYETIFSSLSSHLTPIRVLPRICHGQEAGRVVPQLEVLVLEGAAVDGRHARPVVVHKVAALRNK